VNRCEAGRGGGLLFAEDFVDSSFFSGCFEAFPGRNYPVAAQAGSWQQ
jgi:hypothetical protein